MRFFVQYRSQRQKKGVHVDGALALHPFALPQSVFEIQASFRSSCSFILRDGFLVCFYRRQGTFQFGLASVWYPSLLLPFFLTLGFRIRDLISP